MPYSCTCRRQTLIVCFVIMLYCIYYCINIEYLYSVSRTYTLPVKMLKKNFLSTCINMLCKKTFHCVTSLIAKVICVLSGGMSCQCLRSTKSQVPEHGPLLPWRMQGRIQWSNGSRNPPTPSVLSHPIMESAFKDSEATTQCQNQARGGKKNQETEEQKKGNVQKNEAGWATSKAGWSCVNIKTQIQHRKWKGGGGI